MRRRVGEWMLHADSECEEYPSHREAAAVAKRGTAIELRLHGCDFDAAGAAARAGGCVAVADPAEAPHGLR